MCNVVSFQLESAGIRRRIYPKNKWQMIVCTIGEKNQSRFAAEF